MTANLPITAVPTFARGVRLRYDEAREEWVLLAPERVLNPDPIAVEILKKVDGARSIDLIVDELAEAYSADRTVIAADVDAFLADLIEKGVIELAYPGITGDAAS